MIVVRFLVSNRRLSWINCSVTESKALVASSKITIGAFFNIALAIAILCLCQPDSLTPLSPTNVWYCSGN